MNIGKFLNKMTGRDKLDAYQQAARYQRFLQAQFHRHHILVRQGAALDEPDAVAGVPTTWRRAG